jgi:phage repressor protein C with HTH and peptisase S24 domain
MARRGAPKDAQGHTVISHWHRELGIRIKRVLELYPDRKSAAGAAGKSDDQFVKYIAGETSPTFEAMARLVREKGVSLDWLATGDGPFHTVQRLVKFTEQTGSRPPAVQVVGLAECGLKGWFQRDPLSVNATRPGDFFDPDGFAVIAIGQSMVPAGILEGFLCFCSPATPPSPGDAVYVERTDRVATIKVFNSIKDDWLTVQGWLDEKEGKREPYTERLIASAVRRIAPVIYVKRKL